MTGNNRAIPHQIGNYLSQKIWITCLEVDKKNEFYFPNYFTDLSPYIDLHGKYSNNNDTAKTSENCIAAETKNFRGQIGEVPIHFLSLSIFCSKMLLMHYTKESFSTQPTPNIQLHTHLCSHYQHPCISPTKPMTSPTKNYKAPFSHFLKSPFH